MKILVYRLGSLGDFCVAIPVFRLLRQQYPNASIFLLTNDPVVDIAAGGGSVLEGSGLVDGVITYPLGMRDCVKLIRLLRTLRSSKYDVVVNLVAWRGMNALIRDYLFFRLSGAGRLIGFSSRTCRRLVRLPDGGVESEAARLVRRLWAWDLRDTRGEIPFEMPIGKSEERWANEFLKGCSISGPYLAIGVGTKVDAKDWGRENWIELCRRLSSRLSPIQAVFLGAYPEFVRAEECRKVWIGTAVNLCGKTTPRQSAALLSLARIFIGHDSGPMHLAASVQTPCVAIFAARTPRGQWFPLGGPHKVLYRDTDCAGCGLDICVKERKKCLSQITIDDVVEATVSLLGQIS
jgi:ADP-heptose:LPS heptosyltransferase